MSTVKQCGQELGKRSEQLWEFVWTASRSSKAPEAVGREPRFQLQPLAHWFHGKQVPALHFGSSAILQTGILSTGRAQTLEKMCLAHHKAGVQQSSPGLRFPGADAVFRLLA